MLYIITHPVGHGNTYYRCKVILVGLEARTAARKVVSQTYDTVSKVAVEHCLVVVRRSIPGNLLVSSRVCSN